MAPRGALWSNSGVGRSVCWRLEVSLCSAECGSQRPPLCTHPVPLAACAALARHAAQVVLRRLAVELMRKLDDELRHSTAEDAAMYEHLLQVRRRAGLGWAGLGWAGPDGVACGVPGGLLAA